MEVVAFPPIDNQEAVPVKLVATPDEGVPRAHQETIIFAHSIATTPADILEIVVSEAFQSSILQIISGLSIFIFSRD